MNEMKLTTLSFPRLVLDNVHPGDGGVYRCRVDFYRAPTTIESMVLDVIGESSRVAKSRVNSHTHILPEKQKPSHFLLQLFLSKSRGHPTLKKK